MFLAHALHPLTLGVLQQTKVEMHARHKHATVACKTHACTGHCEEQ